VFCSQCGKNLPEDARFCQSCGRTTAAATAPAPIAASFATAAAAALAPTPTLSPSSVPTTRVLRAPYGWFVFEVLCFTTCAAGFVFLISIATATLDPNKFQKVGGSAMGLLFTAIWAWRTWKRIQEIEPESDGDFKRKHRSYLWRTLGLVVLSLVLACVLGATSGGHQSDATVAMRAVVAAHTERMKGIDQSVNTDTVWSTMANRQSAVDAVRKLQTVQAEEDRLENELSNVFTSTGMNEGKMPTVMVSTFKAERDWSASAIEAINFSLTLDDRFWNTPSQPAPEAAPAGGGNVFDQMARQSQSAPPDADRFATLDPNDRATVERLMKHADEAANTFISAADAQRKYFNLPAKQQ
jgi:hypothetical protein